MQSTPGPNQCCLHSVACFFGIHSTMVPDFGKRGRAVWGRAMFRFFRRRGYKLTREPYTKGMRLNARKLNLMHGRAWRGTNNYHMAVYRGHRPYYDSAGRRQPFKGGPIWVYKAEKIKA